MLTRPSQRAIRLRHGTKPDLSINPVTGIDEFIDALRGTAMLPARHDEIAAGQN